MTMKRTEKAGHQEMLGTVGKAGVTIAEFASPQEIEKRGGRSRMKPEEYVEIRMGRGHRDAGTAREIKAETKTRYRQRPVRK